MDPTYIIIIVVVVVILLSSSCSILLYAFWPSNKPIQPSTPPSTPHSTPPSTPPSSPPSSPPSTPPSSPPQVNIPTDLPIGTTYKDLSSGVLWTVTMVGNTKRLQSNRTFADTYATIDESRKTLTFLPSGYNTPYTITSNGFTIIGDTFTKQ